MLTVIPHNKAVELLQNRSLHEFNTMPQIDQRVRKVIREFMSEMLVTLNYQSLVSGNRMLSIMLLLKILCMCFRST